MSNRKTAPPPGQVAFVQWSDLHVGTGLLPRPEDFWGFPRSGYNPHDFRLLQPLELALADAPRLVGLPTGTPMEMVISGDITQFGTDNDYATSLALLHQRWQWSFDVPGRWLGFALPRDRTHTIPGNHDHWRRAKYQTGYSRGLAPAWFDSTPWRRVIPSPDGTIQLELYGIDSNSGLEDPKKPQKRNLFAAGEVSSAEIARLRQLLKDADAARVTGPSVVRALVCHHAFTGSHTTHGLRQTSLQTLLQLALDFGLRVVLTGHTHTFEVHDWPYTVSTGSTVLKELRCGTTLQGSKAKNGLQGFLVHRIRRVPGTSDCEWTAWRYQTGGKVYQVDEVNPVIFATRSL